LFGLVFFFSLTTSAQSNSAINTKFLNDVVKQNWNEAESCLSGFLKSQIKDGGLKKLFDGISSQVGSLQSFDTIPGHSIDKSKINQYIAHFTKQTLTLQIASNDSSKIIGFYLLPLAQSYKTPQYAISSKIQERKVGIPSGSIKLTGVFTTPIVNDKKKFPLVIFVGGSGPTDEDETMEAEKPFKDISLGLAIQGISSLRFTKRTSTYPDKFKDKSYTINDEYLEDVKNAILFAKTLDDIDSLKIFILGHSQGGMLAPLLLKQNTLLAGAILLEANARPIEDLIYEQSVYLSHFNKDTANATNLKKLKSEIQTIKTISQVDSNKLFFNVKGSYWLSLKSYDPLKTAKALKNAKLLIIQGGKDYQVTEKDYLLWKKTLSPNVNVGFKFYPKINHALVETDGNPLPQDYEIPLNVPFYIITDISSWINKHH